jgi:hypothetical protein
MQIRNNRYYLVNTSDLDMLGVYKKAFVSPNQATYYQYKEFKRQPVVVMDGFAIKFTKFRIIPYIGSRKTPYEEKFPKKIQAKRKAEGKGILAQHPGLASLKGRNNSRSGFLSSLVRVFNNP